MTIKIIADENIPLKIIYRLRDTGINVLSITELNRGISDVEVATLAKKEKGYILTFDKDFGELVFKDKLPIDGVILLRIEPRSIDYIFDRTVKILNFVEFNNEYNFFVVDDEKIRMRKI